MESAINTRLRRIEERLDILECQIPDVVVGGEMNHHHEWCVVFDSMGMAVSRRCNSCGGRETATTSWDG